MPAGRVVGSRGRRILPPGFGVADYLSNTDVAAAYNARHCKVISVMRKWFEFEPSAGTYSFGLLKTAGNGIEFAHNNGIGLFVRFHGGADSPVGRPGVSTATHPDWLRLTPYNVPRFRTLDNDNGSPDRELWMPLLTNATYRTRYNAAVDAWKNWFDDPCPVDPTHNVSTHIIGFSASLATENGAEYGISFCQINNTAGTLTEPIGYGGSYLARSTIDTGGVTAAATTVPLASTASCVVPGLFRISDATSFASTDELVYAATKSAAALTGCIRGVSGTTAQAHAAGKAVRQADESDALAIHTATYNGVTSLKDHHRENRTSWKNADGLGEGLTARQDAIHDLWRTNVLDLLARLEPIPVRTSVAMAGGAFYDNQAGPNALIDELGPIYRRRLHVMTTNLRTDTPVRTAAGQAIPTYAAALPQSYAILKKAQDMGCMVAIQLSSKTVVGARNGQELIDACETGLLEFHGGLTFVEMNGNSRFPDTNGGLGWDTWAAYDWPGGHIADIEDYIVSFNGAFPKALQKRIRAG